MQRHLPTLGGPGYVTTTVCRVGGLGGLFGKSNNPALSGGKGARVAGRGEGGRRRRGEEEGKPGFLLEIGQPFAKLHAGGEHTRDPPHV